MAEYDEDDDDPDRHTIGAERPPAHSRVTSLPKFQWQKADDCRDHPVGGSGVGAKRTSRCYSARTRTVRRSAAPVFHEEFRFEVADDTLLQDEVSEGRDSRV